MTLLRLLAGELEPALLKLPPRAAQGANAPEVACSSVNSKTFPAKSYIFCFFVASDAPVVNNIEFKCKNRKKNAQLMVIYINCSAVCYSYVYIKLI